MLGSYQSQEERKPLVTKKVLLVSSLGAIGLIAAIFFFTSSASPSAPLVAQVQYQTELQEFDSYVKRYKKAYKDKEEYYRRFQIYSDNASYIRVFNTLGRNWKLGINKFSDMTFEEFQSIYLPRKFPITPSTVEYEGGVEIPSSVDWRSKGAVTGVKNQGECGSCWSFSTTGAVEGIWAISGHGLNSLSEQQLIDCSRRFGNNGCNGGLMDNAFKYVKDYGLTSEEVYPYTAKDGSCDSEKVKKKVATISGHRDVSHDNPDALKEAVAKQPVSVAVEADQSAWQHYTGGVVDRSCGTSLDHGVLVVGYGDDHYIVKNSWGKDWGDRGYIMIGIESGKGVCGIQMEPSYPEV